MGSSTGALQRAAGSGRRGGYPKLQAIGHGSVSNTNISSNTKTGYPNLPTTNIV